VGPRQAKRKILQKLSHVVKRTGNDDGGQNMGGGSLLWKENMRSDLEKKTWKELKNTNRVNDRGEKAARRPERQKSKRAKRQKKPQWAEDRFEKESRVRNEIVKPVH